MSRGLSSTSILMRVNCAREFLRRLADLRL